MNYSPEQKSNQDMKIADNFYNNNSISNPSTPLSINKTQSNFNQEDFLNSQYFPTLSPLSLTENRRLKKSITPYPIWYTAEQCRNKKEDSLLINSYEEDKQNMIGGMNLLQGYQNNDYQSESPNNFRRALQQRQTSGKSNRNLQLSNKSKNLIIQSVKKVIQCSNVKTTVNLADVMSIDSSSGVLGNLSKSSKKNQKYHINIQQSSYSPSKIQSSTQTINMIPMVLSKRPQNEQEQRQHEQNNNESEDNQVIQYFLTEQDSQTQYNMSNDGYNVLNELKSELNLIMEDNNDRIQAQKYQKKLSQQITQPKQQNYRSQNYHNRFSKKQNNHLNYCDILQTKIKQLSNNIAILHEKVSNNQSYQISGHTVEDENKKHSTMQSLDSRPDTSNTTINQKPISSLQLQINKKEKDLKKLIYHDSKIIFSKNDSGFVQFSQEFSQILNDSSSQISYQHNKSSRNQDQSRKIVFQNSPVSIDISQQLQHVLGNRIGKSQKGSQVSNRSQSQKQNILQNQDLSQNHENLLFQNQSYLNNNQQIQSPISSKFMTNQKEAFRLSFPKILTHNQSQLSQSDIYDSNHKMKQSQSFISSSSNQTFLQQQINKKFNNKFNQWLMMS